jgi:flagellar FliL protein
MSKKEPPPSDEAGEGEEGAEGGKKKPPLMILIAAGVGALVVLGGGGTAAFMMLNAKKEPPAAEEKGKEHGKKDEKKDKKKEGGEKGKKEGPNPISQGPDGVVYYTLPDLTANIQSSDGRPTYLKLKIALELKDESIAESIEPNLPRLVDGLQTFMRELRPEDMAGSQGNYQLRMEMLRRVNLIIAPEKVNAVLIEENLIN